MNKTVIDRKSLALILLTVSITVSIGSIPNASATHIGGDLFVGHTDISFSPDAPPNPACYELGTCDLFANPLDAMLEPFFGAMGQFFLVIMWGLIIGIIWLRTSNTMLTGVVGIGISSIFVFSEETQLVGVLLLGAAIGMVVYQLYTQRINFPSN
jgi:hypothetical protein